MTKIEITNELIRDYFDYNKDGFLVYKVKYSRKVIIGKIAGRAASDGDVRSVIMIHGVRVMTHRLIFLWHYGYMPIVVDHKDRNQQNNKIENLRAAIFVDNSRNKTSRIGSTSKYLGVNFDKIRGRWLSRISINGKSKNLGRFDSEIDAAIAYDNMAKLHYGEFANINIH